MLCTLRNVRLPGSLEDLARDQGEGVLLLGRLDAGLRGKLEHMGAFGVVLACRMAARHLPKGCTMEQMVPRKFRQPFLQMRRSMLTLHAKACECESCSAGAKVEVASCI